MLCLYTITGTDQNGEHAMRCGRCGKKNKSRYMPSLVHSVCLVQPTAGDTMFRVQYNLGTTLTDEALPRVRTRVAVCVECDHFTGLGCTELASRCRERRFRWFDRLLHGDCPKWLSG